jgi:hypothetical protein
MPHSPGPIPARVSDAIVKTKDLRPCAADYPGGPSHIITSQIYAQCDPPRLVSNRALESAI